MWMFNFWVTNLENPILEELSDTKMLSCMLEYVGIKYKSRQCVGGSQVLIIGNCPLYI